MVRRWSLIIIFTLALGLRLYRLGDSQLWYDESFTLLLARLPWSGMIQATAGDVHPPLWYALEWVLIRLFGESIWIMRLPSVLASMMALYLAYRLTVKLGLSQAATIGTLGFLAINSTQIWYAQEARQYAALEALVLWSVMSVLDRRWIHLWMSLTLMLWLHNYALIYGSVIGIWALIREIRSHGQVWRVAAAGAGALAAWSPWAMMLVNQMNQVAESYWIQPTNAGTAIFTLNAITWGFALQGPMESVAPLVFCGLLILTVIRSIQRRESGRLAWLSLAPLGIALLLEIWRPVLLFRGLIGSVPFLLMWISHTLSPTRRNQIVMAILVIPVLIAGQITWYQQQPAKKGKDSKVIENYVMPYYQPGDLILHSNDGSYVIFTAFSDLPQFELDHGCPDPVGSLSSTTRQALNIQRLTLEDARARGRVFLVGGIGSTSSACEEDYIYQITSQAQELWLEHTDLKHVGVWLFEAQRLSKTDR